MITDVRAREMVQLRQTVRELAQAIGDMENTARANDGILLTLHKLALLFIKKPADWQTQTVTLLKKDFALSYCQLIVFTAKHAALAKTATRLSAGGKSYDTPLPGTDEFPAAKRYFYLPLKQQNKAVGLLVFASKKADAFPDDAARDFSRRLAELLAAVL